ncbi:50S ribosomal protein L25/general stress protein Ctc [Caulobacter sp. RL271]|jgi:large subunit ribosomal protein L25|uniref:Large ribosomal subunit protein bL25 n=1 Tax=Caulobacter segnis TaxID=88688 RepID=A0ABY4ZX62_9CAUL|nr:50S ribosomal protein L25/general stress protein Ctc [Caulobacter segnis]USQ96764.1 50S ribosomal protein L25/general stress protein Ctc [Caulobacter segnis]
MAEIILNVEVREGAGTGAARAVRREGKVPGTLYGGGKAPVNIAVRANEFRKSLYTGKLLGHLVTLQHGDEKQSVIAKSVQFHPVTDEPVHFDLYRVDEHQLIKIEVPVHFKNQDISVGMKKGGSLEVIRHTVELACPADKIPEELVIDLANHDIGDTIRISEVKLPEGVKPAMDRDFVIATLKASSAAQSDAGDTTTEA